MSFISPALRIFKSLKEPLIKTTSKLFGKQSKNTIKDIALGGGRTIPKKAVGEGIKSGAIKSEAKLFAEQFSKGGRKLSGFAGASTVGGLSVLGIAGAGYGGARLLSGGIDTVKDEFAKTKEQRQAEEDLDLRTEAEKLRQKIWENQLKAYEDYLRNIKSGKDGADGNDAPDVPDDGNMSFKDFLDLIKESNPASDIKYFDGGVPTPNGSDSKWIYLLGGLGLVGTGIYIYKKGKKGKK